MIATVLRGQRATGLLAYLFGPGEENEHVDPRVIVAWDGRMHEPDHRQLGALLDSTWKAAQMSPKDRPVYHVVVALARADPENGSVADPHISDELFAEVCGELMGRVGIADSCRWVAVRHDAPGETHAHIVATLATESGRRFHPPKGDFYRLGQVCREFEARFGWRGTAPRERAVPKRPTSPELRKAERNGWREPTRQVLQEQVRAAAGGSTSLDGFFERLRGEGLLVRLRRSPGDGRVVGWAVAQQRPTVDGVEQVWFSGGKLAADLTVGRLRQRWSKPDAVVSAGSVDRGEVWRQAVGAAARAAERVSAAGFDPAAASAAAWEASDFLASLAGMVKGPEGRRLQESSRLFTRAGYAAWGRDEPAVDGGVGLRRAAWLLTAARFSPKAETRALLALMSQLATVAAAVERMRSEQGRAQQAAAARRAAEVLRESVVRSELPDEGLDLQRRRRRLPDRGLVL